MRLNTDGLVIRIRNIGEADRLITILTRECGVLDAFVRGARRLKGRLASSTQQFSYAKFILFKSKDAYVVDEAEPVRLFFEFGNEVEKISLAYYFAELALVLSPHGDDAESFLRLMLNTLSFLIDGKREGVLLKSVLELRLLAMSGYMPNLLGCENCGVFEKDIMYFNPEKACFYCSDCEKHQRYGIPASRGVVSAMRHIVYSEFEKLFQFSISQESLKQLSYITEHYLLTQIQRPFQTLEFYKSIIGT